MMILKTTVEFAAAHDLSSVFEKGHQCTRLHGHNFSLTVYVEGFVDFGVLKRDLRDIVATYDHQCLNDFFSVPLSEVLVAHFAARLRSLGYVVEQVELAESPKNVCIWSTKFDEFSEIHKLQSQGVKASTIEQMIQDGSLYEYNDIGGRWFKGKFVTKSLDLLEAYVPGKSVLVGNEIWQFQVVGDTYEELKLVPNSVDFKLKNSGIPVEEREEDFQKNSEITWDLADVLAATGRI